MSPSPVELLQELVEIESPTGDTAEIQACIEEALAAAGAEVERRGAHLRADVPGDGAPLLLLGHMDTVWPRGTLSRLPFRVEDGRAFGPATFDMKGGLVVLLEALHRADTRHALRIVVNADEEIGSVGSRDVLEEAATGALAALVLEGPTHIGGHLKTARKGIGRFRLTVCGKAAHASTPAEGVSAIHELAHQIICLYFRATGSPSASARSRAARARTSSPPRPRRSWTSASLVSPTATVWTRRCAHCARRSRAPSWS